MTSSNAFQQVKLLGQGMGGVCNLVRRRADQRLYALKEMPLPADEGEATQCRPDKGHYPACPTTGRRNGGQERSPTASTDGGSF